MNKLLSEREKTHGKFEDVASTIQNLKYLIHMSKNWREGNLSVEQRESLEMIAHKIGRILNGDPNVRDHWDDIAGYATLVSERLYKAD
jgi:hypothetical protein